MVTEIDQEYSTADLIAEVRKYAGGGERPPGGVSVAEYAIAEGIMTNSANMILTDLFKEGLLTRHKYRVSDKLVYVYYKATPDALNKENRV